MIMKTELAPSTDYDYWLNLALEIDPLFGPMAEEKSFQNAFKQSIFNKSAFCIGQGIGYFNQVVSAVISN